MRAKRMTTLKPLSNDAHLVAEFLDFPPGGHPIALLSEDAFGKADMVTRGRVKKALAEIGKRWGMDETDEPGETHLFSVPRPAWDMMQAYLVGVNAARIWQPCLPGEPPLT
jgi:hypothetical protein